MYPRDRYGDYLKLISGVISTPNSRSETELVCRRLMVGFKRSSAKGYQLDSCNQLHSGWITVFLTHVGIRLMPTWKAKSFYRVGNFLPTWFFLPLRKFRTIKIKLEKNSYTQTNACLLHISRNFKDIFKYICFTLYLQQTVNNWESLIIFIDRCCLPCFF